MPSLKEVGQFLGWLISRGRGLLLSEREHREEAFKRRREILEARRTRAKDDLKEATNDFERQRIEADLRQIEGELRAVEDGELSYWASVALPLARHVVEERALPGPIVLEVRRLPMLEREALERAAAIWVAAEPSTDAEGHFLRGNAFYETGEFEKGLADYDRSLELRPDHPATLNNRGIAYRHLGRYQEALADYNRSLALRPDHPDTLNNRGIPLHYLGRYQEALADYNRSLELRPDYPDTLNNRGHTLHYLGRYQEALADYDRSLKVRSDHASTIASRAIALRYLERHPEASEAFNQALILLNRALAEQPQDFGTLYDRACLFTAFGRLGEGLEDLEQAIALKPAGRRQAQKEPLFAALREDSEFGPRFRQLIEEGK